MNIVGFLFRKGKRCEIVIFRGQFIRENCVASASKERIKDGFGESMVGVVVKIVSFEPRDVCFTSSDICRDTSIKGVEGECLQIVTDLF